MYIGEHLTSVATIFCNPYSIWIIPTIGCAISNLLMRQYQVGVRHAVAKFFFLFNLASIPLMAIELFCTFAYNNWFKIFLIF